MTIASSTRQARTLRIFQQLQSGGGLNARQLAQQLDVSRRTIFRDLRMMRQAGVRYYFDERLGCYRLETTPAELVGLTLSCEELTTLAVAVHLSPFRQMPDCDDLLVRSVRKLLAESPLQVQHHVSRLVRACSVANRDPSRPAPGFPVVRHLFSAIAQRRKLRLQVEEGEGGRAIETRLAPYQVIATADAWRVVGLSSHHRAVRSFDARQLKRPAMTDQAYAIPRCYQGAL